MISLSKRTDYALLALSYLARLRSESVDCAANTKEIAEQHDIPLELLAKILQQLTRAGIITSTAGPTGGYRLARSPEAISVGAVVRLIDGSPALMQCMREDGNDCEQLSRCTIRTPLVRINARIYEMLELISLAEISDDEASPVPVLSSAIPLTLTTMPSRDVLTKNAN